MSLRQLIIPIKQVAISQSGGRSVPKIIPCTSACRMRSYHASASSGVELAHTNVFRDMSKPFSKNTEHDILSSLRARFPDYSVTMAHCSTGLLAFAKAGQATATFCTDDQLALSWLQYKPTNDIYNHVGSGQFHDRVQFGRYDYGWQDKSYIVYVHCEDYKDDDPELNTYFILCKRGRSDIANGHPNAVKELVAASSLYTNEVHEGDVLVYDDDSWTKSTGLWESVQRSKWENIILDGNLKDTLVQDVQSFFDQRDDYTRFGAPWKRGIIMHGLPGNGKTVTVKALMNGLAARSKPIPTLYVKSGKGDYGVIYGIRKIFKKAREMSPCLLVFEDLDSLITEESRSFFLNEVDGMESNDGIMIIGSTV